RAPRTDHRGAGDRCQDAQQVAEHCGRRGRREMKWLRLLVVVVLGCHRVGKAPVSNQGAEQPRCVAPGPHAKVLLVHWTQPEEEALHQAMMRGLAVVSAGCDGIKLLPACTIRGVYQYFGTTPVAQKFDLQPAELSTNLSFGEQRAITAADGVRIETVRVGRLATAR